MVVHGGKAIFNTDSFTENDISKNPPLNERLKFLEEEIYNQIKRIENEENTEPLEIIYMYYDN